MMALTLACPHETVPLFLHPGETLREWRMRLVDAQHRLDACSACACGAGELAVCEATPARMPAIAPETPLLGLRACQVPECTWPTVEQRAGRPGDDVCFHHSAWGSAQRPARMAWTTQARLVAR